LTGRDWPYPHDPDPDAVRPSVAVIADDRGSVLIDAGVSTADPNSNVIVCNVILGATVGNPRALSTPSISSWVGIFV